MKRWIGVFTLAVVLPAHAEIYRCETEGKTTFQDFPCKEERPERDASLSVTSANQDDNDAALSPLTRLNRRKAAAISKAITQDMPGMKKQAAKQERIDRAFIDRRLTHGMQEEEARLVYGAPHLIEWDSGGCRKLTWRNPDHAARVCGNTVAQVYY